MIFHPQQPDTFSQIGKLTVTTDDLLAEYGYGFSRQRLQLPQFEGPLPQLADTHQRIDDTLPLVDLANETSRRETLIAPVVTDVVIGTQA